MQALTSLRHAVSHAIKPKQPEGIITKIRPEILGEILSRTELTGFTNLSRTSRKMNTLCNESQDVNVQNSRVVRILNTLANKSAVIKKISEDNGFGHEANLFAYFLKKGELDRSPLIEGLKNAFTSDEFKAYLKDISVKSPVPQKSWDSGEVVQNTLICLALLSKEMPKAGFKEIMENISLQYNGKGATLSPLKLHPQVLVEKLFEKVKLVREAQKDAHSQFHRLPNDVTEYLLQLYAQSQLKALRQ